MNPAPAQHVDLLALANLDYFVPNESEAETITGIGVHGVDDAKRCAGELVNGGIHAESSSRSARRAAFSQAFTAANTCPLFL